MFPVFTCTKDPCVPVNGWKLKEMFMTRGIDKNAYISFRNDPKFSNKGMILTIMILNKEKSKAEIFRTRWEKVE